MDRPVRNLEKVAKILEDQDEKLVFDMDVLQRVAQKVKEIFLSTDIAAFKKLDPFVYTWFLVVTYRHLVFFPDPETIQKFEEAGLKERNLQRFVPHSEIVRHLDTIDKGESFVFLKHQAFLHIKEYVETKIGYDLLQWAGFTTQYNGRYAMPKTTIFLRNFFRKRAYSGGTPLEPKNEFEQEYHEMVDNLNTLTGNEKVTRATLLAISNGRTEKIYLKEVTEDCYPRLKSDRFYRKFFPLFKLLVPDRNFPTENDIYRRQRYYGRSFPSLQSQFIRKLIR